MDIFCTEYGYILYGYILEGRTRTNAWNFSPGTSKLKIRKKFCITRAIKPWNGLFLGSFQANIGLPFIWDGFSPGQFPKFLPIFYF